MVQPEPKAVPNAEPEISETEELEALKKALAEEKAKAEKYLANWQRAQADFINYKRYCEQEREQTAKFANASLILSILPALDDLERAFNHAAASGGNGEGWLDGFKLIERKLRAVLEAQGLSEISALGEPFDPSIHEAVRQAPGKEGMVIEEVQKGYKLHDRVLRPSQVVVGAGETEKETEKES